jgi:hypothetical protein
MVTEILTYCVNTINLILQEVKNMFWNVLDGWKCSTQFRSVEGMELNCFARRNTISMFCRPSNDAIIMPKVIGRDLQTPTVKEEIRLNSSQYSARPNGLVVNLIELPDNRRLRRHLPNDLPTTFLV